MADKLFLGIIVYKIEADGCLNGLYTNTFDRETNRGIYNEIAKKNNPDGKTYFDTDIEGKYTTVYIQNENEVCIGDLVITTENHNVYEFNWTSRIVGNKDEIYVKFKGIGLKAGEKYIAVSYWGVQTNI